jgi:biotin transport system substrate-specific component
MSLALSPTRQPVLADFWSHTRTVDVVTILAATGLTALAAQISIPIPGTPVPVTGQTFAVLLTAAALGPIRGGLAQFLYVALAFLVAAQQHSVF